jgi:methyltransferase (TIGR00027 family)
MKAKQSSTTAQGIAAIRAIESSKPPEQRICYDPLARRLVNPAFYVLARLFAGYGDWRAPGVSGFLVARARYIDDTLQTCLDHGLEQLVILGAGLDSRACRFEQLKAGVSVFEVDHPASQQEKRGRLRQIFGELPRHVAFVPIDFNEEGLEKLFEYSYDRGRKTLFIWEGVTYYLTAEAVDRTLVFVSGNSGRGSSIVFDYVAASALTAPHKRGEIARMRRYGRLTGEPLTFGIETGAVEEFLRRRGYNQIEVVTGEDLRARYFVGVNQDRPVAPIYAIARAAVSLPGGGSALPAGRSAAESSHVR